MKKPAIAIMSAITDNIKPMYAQVPGSISIIYLESLIPVNSSALAATIPQIAKNIWDIEGSGAMVGPTVNVSIYPTAKLLQNPANALR